MIAGGVGTRSGDAIDGGETSMFIQTLTCPARPARLRATLRRHAALAVTLVFLIPGATSFKGVDEAPGLCDWFPNWPACP